MIIETKLLKTEDIMQAILNDNISLAIFKKI